MSFSVCPEDVFLEKLEEEEFYTYVNKEQKESYAN